jgi:hypothetical protein
MDNEAKLREALEQIQLLASNHGAWVENGPAKLMSDIHGIASAALAQPPQPAPSVTEAAARRIIAWECAAQRRASSKMAGRPGQRPTASDYAAADRIISALAEGKSGR